MNKYYTPSIEEYFIGMEFYVFRNNTWEKNILTEEGFRCILNFTTNNKFYNKWGISNFQLDPTPIRIKYLDKEDIERLGWVDGETHGLSGYVLNYATDDNYQMYYDTDNQFTQIYNWNFKIIFEGTIKNKSELIKLLKQLNITNE